MPTAQWRTEPAVIQRLLDEPHRFQFFQAVRLLELWLCQNGVPHERALTDYVQFQNSLSLSFPGSEIESLSPQTGISIRTAQELMAALLNGQASGVAITPAFMGYLGVGGVLPNHYTEKIALSQHFHKDEGARAFLDIYMTRALTLFYQASTKYRIEDLRDAHGGDGYRPLLLMLAGVKPSSAKQQADCLPVEMLAYYSGLIRQRSVTGASLTALLSEYFNLPFSVIQFDGCWDLIPKKQQLTLGVKDTAVLGGGATLGVRRWVRDQQVRIRIGPLNKSEFNHFAPGAAGAQALRQLLSTFACAPLRFRIQLLLRKQDVHSVTLGPPAPGKLGLGRDTFLMTRPATADRDSLQYDLHPW